MQTETIKKYLRTLPLYSAIIVICAGGFMVGSIYENTRFSNLTNEMLKDKDEQIKMLQDGIMPKQTKMLEKMEEISNRIEILSNRIEERK